MSETDPHDNSDTTKRGLTGIPLLIVALGVVLFVQALFVLSYIGALHQPKAHRRRLRCRRHVPVADRGRETVFAEGEPVLERVGRARSDRRAEDRRRASLPGRRERS